MESIISKVVTLWFHMHQKFFKSGFSAILKRKMKYERKVEARLLLINSLLTHFSPVSGGIEM